MGDFKSDFMDAVHNRGRDDMADVVGMPDEKDYERIYRIIQKFEKQNPGLLRASLEAGRRDYQLGIHKKKQIFDKNGRAVVSKDSNMVYVFEIPAALYMAIEKEYPTMFRSKKHFAWFKRNFQKLTIGETAK